MKRVVLVLFCVFSLVCVSACVSNTVNFDVTYSIEGTKNSQYFAVTTDDLLSSINDKLDAAGLSLSVKDSGHESDVYFSENGETWKMNVSIFTNDDIKNASYTRSAPTSDPANWVGYIHEVELSLFSDSDEAAARNGQYIRALISAFTPGAEELVEDELGIYGTPGKNTALSESLYRVTMENVVYTYQKGHGEYNSGRFTVTPRDDDLYAQANEEPVTAIRPQ